MTTKSRRTTKPEQTDPKTEQSPAVEETQSPVAPAVEQESGPRRPDSRVEVVTVDECRVSGCPVMEFEPGRGLCMGHFTTRLDLREVARHD